MSKPVTCPLNIHSVAVTGSSGFIGKHTCKALEDKGFTLLRLSRRPAKGEQKWHLDASVEESAERLRGADAVVHLAAYLPSDYEDPLQAPLCCKSNSIGTLNLLQAARLAGVKRFVYTSTVAVYTPSHYPANEESPTIPRRAAAYLASKLAAEVFVASVPFNENPATATLRLASVYGPGMPNSGLVPTFVRHIKSSTPLTIADANRYLTDLVYVADVATAIVETLERGVTGTFNIASGRTVSPLDIVKTTAKILGAGNTKINIAPKSQISIPGYTAIDINKARAELDFNPTGLVAGLSRYIESLP